MREHEPSTPNSTTPNFKTHNFQIKIDPKLYYKNQLRNLILLLNTKLNPELLNRLIYLFLCLSAWSCKEEKKGHSPSAVFQGSPNIEYAKGFTVEKWDNNLTVIKVNSPWPNSDASFTYALVPKEKLGQTDLDKADYDAVIGVPVSRLVATSTTHIPALEALGQIDKLIGFPDTRYISSPKARERIDAGSIKELGHNESLNTEMVIALNPELVIGFGIDNANKAYETIIRSGIPVVYNGEWTEESPLGKAEWIKFFAPFFQAETKADSIFKAIETDYMESKSLASKAVKKPTVLSGSIYRDIWYLPGGKSWASMFLEDANTDYLWKDTEETGSLSLSLEHVLEKGRSAEFWISPSQFTHYAQMEESNQHYSQFLAFKNKKIYTYANSKGATGGMYYFELGPNRPDLILRDLIHIFHPELLPDHKSVFFKPLE